MTDLHLVAFLTNAHDECEPTLAVATRNDADEWYTSEDTRVWPYWSQPLEISYPPPPDGWIDELTIIAQQYAAQQRDARRPTGLAALLAAKPAPAPLTPIARRGF